MPNSEINRIELNHDDTISLEVNVVGFDPQTAVEISGHVTQGNGAIATFYSVAQMPPSGAPWVVSVSAVPPVSFNEGLPIQVVTRAAQVWITMLNPNTDAEANVSTKDSSPLEGSWNSSGWRWAVAYPGQTAWGSSSPPSAAQ